MSKHWNTQWSKKRAFLKSTNIPEDFRNTKLVSCIEPWASKINLKVMMSRCDELAIPLKLRRDTLVGGPTHKALLDGVWVTSISLRHSYFANSILSSIPRKKDGIQVLEIGAGFGGLATLLTTELPIARYIFVDDPVCLEIQKRFISTACTELECTFLSTGDKWEKSKIEPDLVINTHSFAEMDPVDVADYFTRIQSSLPEGGALYSVNLREWKISCFPNFPFDRYWRHELLRKSKYAPRYVESLSVRDSSADSPHPDTLL